MIKSLSLRSNYRTLENYTYLNQASLGLISEKTTQAMHAFLDSIAKHGNTFMSDEDEVGYFDNLRKKASTLFNCNTENLSNLSLCLSWQRRRASFRTINLTVSF